MTIHTPNNPDTLRAQLIFNPRSGDGSQSAARLLAILTALQAEQVVAQVHLLEPESDLAAVIQAALAAEISLFVVCGGDGTIDSVAAALAGNDATLGIIPAGTRNNVALSLGIPLEVEAAVALLRTGRPTPVDMALVVQGDQQRFYLEACSVGLLSALFPSADEIQRGNLIGLGDFLATVISAQAAEMRLVLQDGEELQTRGHGLLVANMPLIGPHFQVDPESGWDDGLLELLIFADPSKLELLGSAMNLAGDRPDDPRIQRLRVRTLSVETDPPMPILVDGFAFGAGSLCIAVQPAILTVIR